MDWTEIILMLGSAGAVSYERWTKESPRNQLKKLREEYQIHAICPEYHMEWGKYILKQAISYDSAKMLELGLDAVRRAKGQIPENQRIAQAYEIVATCERYRLSGPVARLKRRDQLKEYAGQIEKKYFNQDRTPKAGAAFGHKAERDKEFALLAHALGYIHQLLGGNYHRQEALSWYKQAEELGYRNHIGSREKESLTARMEKLRGDSTSIDVVREVAQRLWLRLRDTPPLGAIISGVTVAGLITLVPLFFGNSLVLGPLYKIHFAPPFVILLLMDIVLALALSLWFASWEK